MKTELTNRKLAALRDNIERVIVGKRGSVDLAVMALIADGHLLIEDVPGVGKTMLARAIAASIEGVFKRIQFTSDLLPSDVTGVMVYNQKSGAFDFKAGPIFGNVILADEINRATPRTQSSLLEAMEERQVTVDGTIHPLPQPFLVIGTQNPIEFEGTYPLPMSQLDRFTERIKMGYMQPAEEKKMLQERKENRPVEEIKPVMSREELLEIQRAVREVRVDDSLYDYVVAIINATRGSEKLALGASPRAALSLFRTAQAAALLAGRDYMIPDDVKRAVGPVLSHRVIVRSPVHFKGQPSETALDELLGEVPVPL